jgi:hypothetical protein
MLDGIRESLRQLRSEKGGIKADLQRLRSEPKPEEVGFWENLQTGIARGALDYVVKPSLALMDTLGHAAAGDFQPLMDMGERVGRGALETVSAFDPMGNAYEPTVASQASRMEELRKRAEARQGETIKLIDRGLRVEESKDPSLKGRITRGAGAMLTGAVPAIATGVLSGGSIPAVATTTALQSAAQPENLALNVGASVTPIPIGRVVAPILRRIRGAKAPVSKVALPEGITAETRPLPELQGPARPTRRLPDLVDENASTQGLKEMERPPIPVFEPTETLPSLSTRMYTSGPKASFESELRDIPLESLVTKAERTPVLETISALRKAGLLTGLKTHIKNVGGTGLFQLSEEASRIPGSIADMAISAITKQRTISGPSLQAMAKSAREAATKGIQEAREIIKRGISEADLERLQLPTEINSGSKVLDGYVNGVFRLLNAEDRIFKTYAMRRSLEDRARVTALNEMREGLISSKEVMKRADDLVANPTESMMADSIADSEIATFTEANRISEGIQAFKEKQGPVGQFATDMIVPFTKTPSNIIGQMLNYSPYGFGKNVFQISKAIVNRGMTPAEQRAFSQTFGRASIGSGLIALGWKLYDKGLMTGLIEDEPSKRARDEATGRIPGAILNPLTNTWHQVVGFAPLGNLLAIGATLAREVDQEHEDSGLLPTLEVAGQAIGEQPLLIGSRQIAESLAKPGSFGERTLGGAIGSFVPTLASDIAEGIDPLQRETKGQGILGQAQKRFPFLRESLPEAFDVLGRPKEDIGPLQALADPTRATTDIAQTNPLMDELVRLDQGISGFRQKSGETIEGYHKRVRSFGQLYSHYGLMLIDSPQYKGANDDDKREVFKLLNSRSKSLVDEGDQREAPMKLSPQSLFDSLRQRRERKEKN